VSRSDQKATALLFLSSLAARMRIERAADEAALKETLFNLRHLLSDIFRLALVKMRDFLTPFFT